MLVPRDIVNGSKLSVTIHLSECQTSPDAPRLAMNGIVVRTEPRTTGMCGVAIKFHNYRFL